MSTEISVDLDVDGALMHVGTAVAVGYDNVVGHLVATRAHIGSSPAIGIRPLSVLP